MPVEVGWGGDNIALSIRSFFGAIHLAKREGWRVYLSVPEVPETCKQIPPTISLDDQLTRRAWMDADWSVALPDQAVT